MPKVTSSVTEINVSSKIVEELKIIYLSENKNEMISVSQAYIDNHIVEIIFPITEIKEIKMKVGK